MLNKLMGLEQIRKLKEEAGKPKPKKQYVLPKKSAKRIAKEKDQKEAGTDSRMDKFFASQRKFMKGKCLFCGGKTEKLNDETFFFSQAHLLPKSIFPSVSMLPEILIELCFYGNSCHTNFDNGMITWEFLKDSKEWDIISEKLHIILPLVAEEERKHKLYQRLLDLIYKP